jgi:hypothetical protein
MYRWIWTKLPGGLLGKLAASTVALAAMVALLFLVVFPWATPRLPFEHTSVNPTITRYNDSVVQGSPTRHQPRSSATPLP